MGKLLLIIMIVFWSCLCAVELRHTNKIRDIIPSSEEDISIIRKDMKMLVIFTALFLVFEFAGILFLVSSNDSFSNAEVLLQTVKWFSFLLFFAPNLLVILVSIFAVSRDRKAIKNYCNRIRGVEDNIAASDNNHRSSWTIVIVFLLIVMAISILYLKTVISAKSLIIIGAFSSVLTAWAIVLTEKSGE